MRFMHFDHIARLDEQIESSGSSVWRVDAKVRVDDKNVVCVGVGGAE